MNQLNSKKKQNKPEQMRGLDRPIPQKKEQNKTKQKNPKDDLAEHPCAFHKQ